MCSIYATPSIYVVQFETHLNINKQFTQTYNQTHIHTHTHTKSAYERTICPVFKSVPCRTMLTVWPGGIQPVSTDAAYNLDIYSSIHTHKCKQTASSRLSNKFIWSRYSSRCLLDLLLGHRRQQTRKRRKPHTHTHIVLQFLCVCILRLFSSGENVFSSMCFLLSHFTDNLPSHLGAHSRAAKDMRIYGGYCCDDLQTDEFLSRDGFGAFAYQEVEARMSFERSRRTAHAETDSSSCTTDPCGFMGFIQWWNLVLAGDLWVAVATHHRDFSTVVYSTKVGKVHSYSASAFGAWNG